MLSYLVIKKKVDCILSVCSSYRHNIEHNRKPFEHRMLKSTIGEKLSTRLIGWSMLVK